MRKVFLTALCCVGLGVLSVNGADTSDPMRVMLEDYRFDFDTINSLVGSGITLSPGDSLYESFRVLPTYEEWARCFYALKNESFTDEDKDKLLQPLLVQESDKVMISPYFTLCKTQEGSWEVCSTQEVARKLFIANTRLFYDLMGKSD